jgi:ABC-type uncharacterized transport system auxiliary subunit
VHMRRIQQIALVFLIAQILAGCGAARPVKYYVLDPGAAPASASSSQLPITLLVAHVTSSTLYREDRLVFGSGTTELGTYEYDRWAEVPADMTQDILVNSLRSTGNYRAVSRVSSSMRGDYLVRGNLRALDEVESPDLAARFSFQLELFDPKTGLTVWSDSYTHDEPVAGGKKGAKVSDVVEALDKNVHAGMSQLTANLGQYFASHPPPSH